MNLALLIWAYSSALRFFEAASWISGVTLFVCFVVLVFSFDPYSKILKENREVIFKYFKRSLAIFFFCISMFLLIPEKSTIKWMAAGYIAQTAYESKAVGDALETLPPKMIDWLNLQLDAEINDLQEILNQEKTK